jgi:hypothetical protein
MERPREEVAVGHRADGGNRELLEKLRLPPATKPLVKDRAIWEEGRVRAEFDVGRPP